MNHPHSLPVFDACKGCESLHLSAPVVIDDQPVILNYRFVDPSKSSAVARRPIALRECRDCGLVFNAAFDESSVPYDKGYENRHGYSSAFESHTSHVAAMIRSMTPASHPHYLDVGCGKGDFIKKLVKGSGGTGEGYDTSYEGPIHDGGVTFHSKYLTSDNLHGIFDAIILRHVVEHVSNIGKFLDELHLMASGAGGALVFLETPRLDWILENRAAWDVFYEHCNYFSDAALAFLCRKSGFRVLRHDSVFSDQYQLLALSPVDAANQTISNPEVSAFRASPNGGSLDSDPASKSLPPGNAIGALGSIVMDSMDRLSRRIESLCSAGDWAIWGAGAKGICLANRLPRQGLTMLLDKNPGKQGGYVPGTKIPIHPPSQDLVESLKLILIANPTYEAEIRMELETLHFSGSILVLEPANL